MKAIDLLEKYPKTAQVVNEFYRSKMIESLNTEDVPEDFKELVIFSKLFNEVKYL